MMSRLPKDLLNALKLLLFPSAFLEAEDRNIAIANARAASGTSVADRAALVRRAFWRSGLLVAAAFGAGALAARCVDAAGYGLISGWQLLLQACSAAVLLWGTVFVRGWDIQTYGGATLVGRAKSHAVLDALCERNRPWRLCNAVPSAHASLKSETAKRALTMSGARQTPVRVDGETVEVWTSKDGKSWLAWATFRGRREEARGPSESSALSAWRSAANHVANE